MSGADEGPPPEQARLGDLVARLVARGEERFVAGDLAAARAAFGSVIDAVPGHAVAWNDLGTVLHAERRFEDAELAFLRSAVFAAEPSLALENLIRLAWQRGRQPEARALLDRLESLAPAQAAALSDALDRVDLTAVDVLAVGCSPSSGSTMFADLLDSLPGVVCGPESNIFCHRAAYRPGGAPGWVERPLPAPSVYIPGHHFFSPILDEVGLDGTQRAALVRGSVDLADFVERYRRYYTGFRERDARILADKTPVNVNCLPEFCTYFGPRGLFVHLVRDGRSVAASLTGRGFTLYEAAFTWIAQVYRGQYARRFSNAIELRYEDLLREGYAVLAELAELLGLHVEPDEIERRHADNAYRGGLTRVASWSVPSFTGRIKATRGYRERLDPTAIATLQRVVTRGVALPGAPPAGVGLADVLSAYGYPLDELDVGEDRIRACFAEWEAGYSKARRRRVGGGQPLLSLSDPP